jgi:hypothetical protein
LMAFQHHQQILLFPLAGPVGDKFPTAVYHSAGTASVLRILALDFGTPLRTPSTMRWAGIANIMHYRIISAAV